MSGDLNEQVAITKYILPDICISKGKTTTNTQNSLHLVHIELPFTSWYR